MYAVLTIAPVGIRAQNNDAGCTVEKNQATCNWAAFKKTLDAAHTVKVEYRDRDKSTGAQLKTLVDKLGKTLVTGEDKPDLTMNVIPATASGIDMDSGDKEILELHVYAGESSPQNLIWVETYVGQRDRPWPANVQMTISQFKKRLAKEK